jgi:hypothetical protein
VRDVTSEGRRRRIRGRGAAGPSQRRRAEESRRSIWRRRRPAAIITTTCRALGDGDRGCASAPKGCAKGLQRYREGGWAVKRWARASLELHMATLEASCSHVTMLTGVHGWNPAKVGDPPAAIRSRHATSAKPFLCFPTPPPLLTSYLVRRSAKMTGIRARLGNLRNLTSSQLCTTVQTEKDVSETSATKYLYCTVLCMASGARRSDPWTRWFYKCIIVWIPSRRRCLGQRLCCYF